MTADAALIALFVWLGLITWATRLAGWALARHLNLPPRGRAALEAVPGAILMALIAPAVVNGGPAAWTGAAVAAVCLKLRVPAFATVIAGVGMAIAIRAWVG